MFRHALMNFGDKFNKAEVDDIFGEFEVDDDGFIASKDVIGLFVAGGGEEKKEEARHVRLLYSGQSTSGERLTRRLDPSKQDQGRREPTRRVVGRVQPDNRRSQNASRGWGGG